MSKYIEQPKKSSWEVYAWVHRKLIVLTEVTFCVHSYLWKQVSE